MITFRLTHVIKMFKKSENTYKPISRNNSIKTTADLITDSYRFSKYMPSMNCIPVLNILKKRENKIVSRNLIITTVIDNCGINQQITQSISSKASHNKTGHQKPKYGNSIYSSSFE